MDGNSLNPTSEARRLAMLIDGDNAQPSLLEAMLTEASKYGVLSIRRIYGDWTNANMGGWKKTLQTHAIQPIQQFRYSVGKNATDSALIIDAMDLLYNGRLDGYVLVSSDSDYTRLATRLRENRLFVMGIGKQNTPRAFVNACDVFVYTENLIAPPPAPPVVPVPGPKPAPVELFRSAFDLAGSDNDWVNLSAYGNLLRQLDPGFDSRTYGYRQLSIMVRSYKELFETKKVANGDVFVRPKAPLMPPEKLRTEPPNETKSRRRKSRKDTPEAPVAAVPEPASEVVPAEAAEAPKKKRRSRAKKDRDGD